MLNTMFNAKKANTISESERMLVANAMKEAGYDCVEPEMVQKVPNKYNSDVYVAVIGDAMVVYTPQWKWGNGQGSNNGIKVVAF